VTYRIQIEKQGCQGHARCANRAPELFALDPNDGYIAMDGFEVPEGRELEAFAGAVSCPERIITMLDESGQPVRSRSALRGDHPAQK
jgi:ferredoxin